MGMRLLAMSDGALSAGQEDSQIITESLSMAPTPAKSSRSPSSTRPIPTAAEVTQGLHAWGGTSAKGKYLFSIILSAYVSQHRVAPKLEGCDELDRPIVTGLRVGS